MAKGKGRPGGFWRFVRGLFVTVLLVLLIGPPVMVLIYRFVPPPITVLVVRGFMATTVAVLSASGWS